MRTVIPAPVTMCLTWTLALLLAACNLTASVPADTLTVPTATPAVAQTVLGTPIPTLARFYQPVAGTRPPQTGTAEDAEAALLDAVAASATAADPCTPEDAAGSDSAPRPAAQHRVSATIDYGERSVEARQTVTYRNRFTMPLENIVLNVEANRWLEAFTLIGILQKNTPQGSITPTHTLTGRRLFIELAEPLPPGCVLTLELVFRIAVPQIRGGVEAFDGYFGYSSRQLNLGHWLPSVAVRRGREWITRQAMFVGEQEVVDKADWDITLRLTNAPASVKIAAPGVVEALADDQWRYVLPAARDFPVSLGDGFIVSRAPSELGVTVEVYTFSDAQVQTPRGPVDGANFVLNLGLRSFETYSDLFGPYPYDRLLIVQGDFPDGMEFSGLVFVSTNWFTAYQGDPAAFLMLITIHEVAHQWWYLRVGNDPAMTPWLDEALATYSEYIFIEAFYPSLKDWWWEFRVDSHAPTGFVDSTIYEFTTIRQYINAVYLRGVRMLHAIRQDIGTEAFFDLLRRYADEGAGKVVDSAFFWSLLTPEQLEATAATRRRYLRQPEVGGGP